MDRLEFENILSQADRIHEDKQIIRSMQFDIRIKEDELKKKLLEANAFDLLSVNYSRLRLMHRNRLKSK